MRWRTRIIVSGLAVAFVVAGLSGAFDKGDGPAAAPPPAAGGPSLPAPSPAAAEPAPSRMFGPTFLKTGPGRHVIVWRDDKAMTKGLRLIDDGASSNLLLPLIACLADDGSRITVTDGGMFSSTITVISGAQTGCEGDIDNSFFEHRPGGSAR